MNELASLANGHLGNGSKRIKGVMVRRDDFRKSTDRQKSSDTPVTDPEVPEDC